MTTDATVATSPDDAIRLARETHQLGDVILVMGAGDIYRTAQALADNGGTR